jgi:L-alanine-DL-glutamate epimerase-like enolase superfamily enzyme
MTDVRDIGDLRDFDQFLRGRSAAVRARLRDLLAGRRLTLAQVRRHRVLLPMVGVYTPGWQALPACSWEFVELVTNEGLVGTGEWSVQLDEAAIDALQQLADTPGKNLLDDDLEVPLFMAWWDLVGQVLGKPLHVLWAELFEVGFEPPGEVPLAAYSWQRFADAEGRDAVTFDNWPCFAAEQCAAGYRTLKLSMTSYEPEDFIDLIGRIRAAIPPSVEIRIDTHGSWNFTEARRIVPRLEPFDISYIEQPFNALLPHRFYPADAILPAERPGGYQREYYFRKLEELRRHTTIPFSCHWWTPPIVQPAGANRMSDSWSFDWHMIERYDPVDIGVPDIGLGVFGLWRLLQMARFMGLHVTIHSNFELGLQSRFRAMMFSALGYYPESAGIYLGTSPRLCMAMDTEYNQVRDDVLVGGKLPFRNGRIALGQDAGHGLRLDPERVLRYGYTEAHIRPHRAFATKLYDDYRLDRPRRRTMSGWHKDHGPERLSRHIYPYDVTGILGIDRDQDVDVELNT